MSITSETQRKYDPNKGGFSYYTLFRADKGERPGFADVGDIVEEFGEGGKVYVCSRDAKGRIKWTEKADWDRQTGGGSGGSLPADFPAEGSENADKFLGFDENGDYAALAAPSGAEKFVVTLTKEQGTWTSDKTIAEIVAAVNANKIVEGYAIGLVDYPLLLVPSVAYTYEGVSYVGFYSAFGADNNYAVKIIVGTDQGGSDYFFDESSGLVPSSTAANNGKVLTVGANGYPVWAASNAPLIVTMTEDQQTQGTHVGDKTNKEAYDAFVAGRPVVAYFSANDTAFSCQAAAIAGTTYSLGFVNSLSSDGAADEYVTITVGN